MSLTQISSLPRLPIELCEAVICSLDQRHDKDTLRNCSLTCKTFLPASRRQLFHCVRLYGSHRTRRFLAICLINSPTTGSPAAYVRQLQIAPHDKWVAALPILAIRLPGVIMLKLQYLKWGLLHDTVRNTLISGFREVKHLDVEHGIFETWAQMHQFIVSFPFLTDLAFREGSHLSRHGAQEMPNVPLPHNLNTIRLDTSQSLFFHRLLSLGSHHCVRNLKMRYLYSRDIRGVGKLLKTLGSSLEHLELGEVNVGFQNWQSTTEAILNDIDLAHNTNLRSISLCYCDAYSLVLLPQITSPHLALVTLRIPEVLENLGTVDWAGIENMFAQQRWTNLPELLLVPSVDEEAKQAAAAFIRTYLPILNSRGFLRVA